MTVKRIIISGGGTAGHIYPALAVGKKILEKAPGCSLTFVGTRRPLEKRIMERAGVPFIPLRIEGLKGRGLKALRAALLLPFALLKSLALLVRIRPDLVIGVGGYSAGPIVLLASWMGIPTLIMEQNTRPGMTNRLLSRWVRKAVVAFESSLPYFRGKGVFIGNPVRESFYTLPPKPRNNRLSVLVFGGSQGSHFLNKGMRDALPYLRKERHRLRIFHQTGDRDLLWIEEGYAREGFQDVTVAPYFEDMDAYFQKADLVISRAGASTIAELIASRKASVLIPFSQATDDHQLWNARELEKVHGAVVLREEEFDPRVFAEKILDFLDHKDRLDAMEKNLSALRTENVAEKIVDECFRLMNANYQEKARG